MFQLFILLMATYSGSSNYSLFIDIKPINYLLIKKKYSGGRTALADKRKFEEKCLQMVQKCRTKISTISVTSLQLSSWVVTCRATKPSRLTSCNLFWFLWCALCWRSLCTTYATCTKIFSKLPVFLSHSLLTATYKSRTIFLHNKLHFFRCLVGK